MEIIPITPIDQLDAESIEDMFSTESEIDQLAQSLSPQIALLILKEFRGATLGVPKNMKPDNWLSEKIGFQNAQLVSDYMGGGKITVPARHPAHVFVQECQVRSMLEAGLSGPQIATELGISDRQVRRIKSRIGLSGVSYVPHYKTALLPPTGDISPTQSLPAPPESVFNGGGNGGVCLFCWL